jgi:hypothetical protein
MSTSNGTIESGPLASEATPSVVYDVQTAFENMNKSVLIASSSAVYFAEMLVTHPFEVLRTQIQTSQTASSIDIIRRNLNAGGVKGLYAGFWPATFGHLPGNCVYLMTYTYLKDALQKAENARHSDRIPDGRQAPWVSFTAAMGADAACVAFYCPVDVVVQRLYLQSNQGAQYSGYRDVVNAILKQEGWRGFYRGVGPILLNSLPASAVWWTIYEECKTYFSQWIESLNNDGGAKYKWHGIPLGKRSEDPDQSKTTSDGTKQVTIHKHAVANMAAGGLAGAVVTFMTNPLDVVRTRLQTQSMKAESYQYSSAWHTVKEMWQAEGVRAFFKGCTPRLTQWVIFSSASAFAYEFVVDISTKR